MKLLTILVSSVLFVRALAAEALPEFRPALLGTHQRSLINLIDAQSLMKRGQGDGFIMFSCFVTEQGYGGGGHTFRGTDKTAFAAPRSD